MRGMDMLLKSVMDSLDDNTKRAIEAIPQNVAAIAEKLRSIDERLSNLEQAGTCKRLEAIEIELSTIHSKIDGHTVRLDAIRIAINSLRPDYTPDGWAPIAQPTASLAHGTPSIPRPYYTPEISMENDAPQVLAVPIQPGEFASEDGSRFGIKITQERDH